MEQFIARSGLRFNLVQLPTQYGVRARNLTKARLNTLSKNELLAEAEFRNINADARTNKPVIIDLLLQYYSRFHETLTNIKDFRFIEPVALLITRGEGIVNPHTIYEQGRLEVTQVNQTVPPSPFQPILHTKPSPFQPFQRTQPVLSPLGTAVPTTVLSPLNTGPSPYQPIQRNQPVLIPVGTGVPTVDLPPLFQPTVFQPVHPTQSGFLPVSELKLPPLPTAFGITKAYKDNDYSLEAIYGLSQYAALERYRSLINDPNAGAGFSLGRLRNSMVDIGHKRKLVSDNDFAIHNSKGMKMMHEDFSNERLHLLIDKYNLREKIGFHYNNAQLALVLYRNGVGFYDLMYVISKEPDLITGSIGYVPKPGEIIEGIYEPTGKVDKNQNDRVNPVPGNPYTYLHQNTLSNIASERDLAVGKNKHQIVYIRTLSDYDKIDPTWIMNVLDPKYNHTRNQSLFLLGDLGINVGDLETRNLSDDELKHMVNIGRIIMATRQPLPARQTIKEYNNNNGLSFVDAYNLSNNEGYIMKEININFPFSIFGKNQNKTDTLKYINELSSYPAITTADEYKIIIDERDTRLIKKLLYEKYKTEDVMLLSDNDVLFISSRGYILPNDKLQETKQRYETIKTLSNDVIRKLRRVYGLITIGADDIQDLKYAIATKNIHPLEPLVIYVDQIMTDKTKTIEEKNKIATTYENNIGMMIPPNIEDKLTYLWTNIYRYRNVLTRDATISPIDKNLLSGDILSDIEVGQLLMSYTDQEIFVHTGVYLPYTSRRNIIDNVNQVRRNSKFLVPVSRACANKETITTIDDTLDMKIFIIGYGTIFEYICFNMADFDENFRDFPIEGIEGDTAFRFRNPNQPAQNFTREEVERLVELLSLYTNQPEVTDMIKRIRDGIVKIRDLTAYDKNVYSTFIKLPDSDKPLIRDWLYQLFYSGMYMRRWQGPPNPYPMTKALTTGPDPEIKVNEELGKLGEIENKLSPQGKKLVTELRSIEYLKGDNNIRVPRHDPTATIGYYLNRIRKNDYCIRMASSYVIGTANYYLGVFYGQEIPNFDPTKLDEIV